MDLKARKEEIRKQYSQLAERRQQDLSEMVRLEGANREIDRIIKEQEEAEKPNKEEKPQEEKKAKEGDKDAK